jgi:MFS family permease
MTYVYVLEVLPFALRTKGMAIFSMCSYVSAFFNIFVNPIALEKLAWKYYFVYIGVNLFAIVAIWFLYPETKGRLLEEVALIFDGPGGELDAATPENVDENDIDDDLKLRNKTEADHREFSRDLSLRRNPDSVEDRSLGEQGTVYIVVLTTAPTNRV